MSLKVFPTTTVTGSSLLSGVSSDLRKAWISPAACSPKYGGIFGEESVHIIFSLKVSIEFELLVGVVESAIDLPKLAFSEKVHWWGFSSAEELTITSPGVSVIPRFLTCPSY